MNAAMSKSRKRPAEDDAPVKKRATEGEAPAKAPADGEAPAKKRRRKAKPKFEDDSLIDLELGVNAAIAKLDSQLMADHLAQKTSRFGADLSSVELSDLSIPGKQKF